MLFEHAAPDEMREHLMALEEQLRAQERVHTLWLAARKCGRRRHPSRDGRDSDVGVDRQIEFLEETPYPIEPLIEQGHVFVERREHDALEASLMSPHNLPECCIHIVE